MKKTISIGLFIVLVISGLWYFQHAKNTSSRTNSIKIGAVLPLTGPLASYGESMRNAINLAIENSGMKDKIQLIIEDDKSCETKEAVTIVQKLISVDKVQVIVGPACTSPALAVVPIAEENKIVLVAASASGKSLTGAGKYIFRTYSSDADKSTELAKYAYNKGYRKAAFIHDSSQDPAVSATDDVKNTFTKLGGKIVADETFLSKDKDMRTQLNKIKSSEPDIIFLWAFPNDMALLLKQEKALGINSALASIDSEVSFSVLNSAGVSAEGMFAPTSVSPTNKEAVAFVDSYKAKYKTSPLIFSAEFYDATMLLIQAGLASDGSGPSIKSQLEKIGQKYQGASGEISFDKNGDVKKPIVMKKVSGGKLVDAE